MLRLVNIVSTRWKTWKAHRSHRATNRQCAGLHPRCGPSTRAYWRGGRTVSGRRGPGQGVSESINLTADAFIPNPFDDARSPRLYRTGDRARYLADGNIAYLGRADSQVKVRRITESSSVRLKPSFSTHPAVIESVVTAPEGSQGAKRLLAYVTCRSNSSASELRAFLKARLPEHMVPSAFVFLDSFPRTPNGKIDRAALPAASPLPTEVLGEFASPTNPVQAHLARI